MIEFIPSFILLAFMWVVASCLWHNRRTGISPVPTLAPVKHEAIKLLLTHGSKKEIQNIAELGSGWGGVTLSLSRAFPKASITGLELSPWPRRISKLRTILRSHIKIKNADIFDEDLSQYDAIFCYLIPSHLDRLKENLKSAKSGALIVTCSFPIEGWAPLGVKTIKAGVKIPVHIYRL
jgi:predicted O-methyltransferase YrrM